MPNRVQRIPQVENLGSSAASAPLSGKAPPQKRLRRKLTAVRCLVQAAALAGGGDSAGAHVAVEAALAAAHELADAAETLADEAGTAHVRTLLLKRLPAEVHGDVVAGRLLASVMHLGWWDGTGLLAGIAASCR